MVGKRGLIGLVAGVATLAVVVPSSASGAVTFGSDLEDPFGGGSALVGFTDVLRTLDADDQAPGGATAPSNGVITGWRVKKGPQAATLAFRVVRGNTSIHQGQPTIFPNPEGIFRFDTRVSVQAGDAIGFDQISAAPVQLSASAGTWSYWNPLLGPNETRAPTGTQGSQLLINADLEPDCDNDGFGDETQDPSTESCQPPPPEALEPPSNDFSFGKLKRNKRNGTAKLAVEVPGPGALELAGNGLKQSSKEASAAGTVKLKVKAKSKKKRKLNQKGKTKVKPRVTYTPTGGSASTKSKKVKLVKR